jgi:hypothetical protein
MIQRVRAGAGKSDRVLRGAGNRSDRGHRDCQYERSNREPGRQGSRISCKKNTRESISDL